jgi:phenylalanyl-tRNA synthetase beta chain
MEAFPRIGLEIEESKKLESGEGYQVDLNVLANRPDELGIIGVAREVAAHFNTKLKYPPATLPANVGDGGLSVEIRDPDLCPRYLGAVITGVKVGPSPNCCRRSWSR